MSNIDNLLAIGTVWDWITPLLNKAQGYNRSAVAGVSFDDAYVEQIRLKELGIKSRIEGGFSSYNVVVKGRG